MNTSSELRTTQNKARDLGSAHHGVTHWWVQRVTAVALIPLSLWFMYSLLSVMLSPDVGQVAGWFAAPVNAIVMVLLLIATFWHAKLGMEVVIEDYVHTPFSKYTLLLANNFICFGFAAVSIVAVLKLHFLDVAGAM